MSRRKKIALRIAGFTAVCAAWLYWHKDSYITRAVETYGSAILGVPVKLGSSHLSVAAQCLSLNRLTVGNPSGFKSKYLLQLDEVTISLDVSSLARDVILVHEITLLKPEITYEKVGRATNIDVVQRNADTYAKDTARKLGIKLEAEGKKAPEKRFIISDVMVKDGRAAVQSDAVLTPNLTVSLPNLHLRDIGKSTNGATSADATKQVVGAITASVTNAVGSAIADAAKGVTRELSKGAKSLGTALNGLFK